MKTEYLLLDELEPQRIGYHVHVRVLRKGIIGIVTGLGASYQALLLEDCKGNRAKGLLLGSHVDKFRNLHVRDSIYEMSNAPILPSNSEWKSGPREIAYWLQLDALVDIKPVNIVPDCNTITCQPIDVIQSVGFNQQSVDVLGVVIYVDENHRDITWKGRPTAVRDLVLLDQSTTFPLFITLLDELATKGCPAISPWGEEFIVVGFTGLAPTHDKGVSLATTAETTVSQYPLGHVADKMRDWVANSRDVLVKKRVQLCDSFTPPLVIEINTIEQLHPKLVLAHSGQRCWINAKIKSLERSQVNAYVGCSECGSPTDLPLRCQFGCNCCLANHTYASPCVKITCEVVDKTGSLPITAETKISEILMRLPAPDIFKLRHSANTLPFEQLCLQALEYSALLELTAKQLSPTSVWWCWKLTSIDVPVVQPICSLKCQHSSCKQNSLANDSQQQTEPVEITVTNFKCKEVRQGKTELPSISAVTNTNVEDSGASNVEAGSCA